MFCFFIGFLQVLVLQDSLRCCSTSSSTLAPVPVPDQYLHIYCYYALMLHVMLWSIGMDAAGGHARSIWAMVHCGARAVRQHRPPKWPRDSHALRRPASGLTAFASAAFGHGDRLGIHVVLHNTNRFVSTGQALVQVLQYCSTALLLQDLVCSTAVPEGTP